MMNNMLVNRTAACSRILYAAPRRLKHGTSVTTRGAGDATQCTLLNKTADDGD